VVVKWAVDIRKYKRISTDMNDKKHEVTSMRIAGAIKRAAGDLGVTNAAEFIRDCAEAWLSLRDLVRVTDDARKIERAYTAIAYIFMVKYPSANPCEDCGEPIDHSDCTEYCVDCGAEREHYADDRNSFG